MDLSPALRQPVSRAFRRVLLSSLCLTMAMIAWRVAGYRSMLQLPGGATMLAESLALLLLYCTLMAWPENRSSTTWRPQLTAWVGCAAAAPQLVHLAVERFVTVPSRWSGTVTVAFELSTFLLWGSAAYRARILGGRMWDSLRAAAFAAVITMSIVMLAGVALEYYLAPMPEVSMADWAEYKRSGWSDLHAFAIANTLDSVNSHLFAAPVVACLFGLVGWSLAASVGVFRRSRHR